MVVGLLIRYTDMSCGCRFFYIRLKLLVYCRSDLNTAHCWNVNKEYERTKQSSKCITMTRVLSKCIKPKLNPCGSFCGKYTFSKKLGLSQFQTSTRLWKCSAQTTRHFLSQIVVMLMWGSTNHTTARSSDQMYWFQDYSTRRNPRLD